MRLNARNKNGTPDKKPTPRLIQHIQTYSMWNTWSLTDWCLVGNKGSFAPNRDWIQPPSATLLSSHQSVDVDFSLPFGGSSRIQTGSQFPYSSFAVPDTRSKTDRGSP